MPDEIRPATYQDILAAEAKRQGVDPRLAIAIAETESAFNPAAKSPAGALGLMQLMPATAKKWGVDPLDPIQNIRGGVSELKALLDEHRGDVVMALRRYNASPKADFSVTDPYVQKVLGRLKPGTGEAPGASVGNRGRLVARPPTQAVSGPQTPEEAAGGPPQLPGLPSLSELPRQPVPAPPEVGRGAALAGGAAELATSIGEAVDPRTREGRRNIAGGVGGALATGALVATAPVTAPVAGLTALTAGVLGAAGGGMLEEAGEQLIGTAPASSLEVAKAGGQQALYEAGGQAVMWPVKALGRRVIASKVGRAAHEGLQRARLATMTRLDRAVNAATMAAGDVKALVSDTIAFSRRRGQALVRSAAERARGGVETAQEVATGLTKGARGKAAEQIKTARMAAGETVKTAEARGAEGLTAAQARGAAGVEAAAKPYSELVAQPPSTAMAGRAAQQVIEGPATEARNIVGKQVERTAKDGPAIDISELKAEAQAILERIKPPEATFPRRVVEEGAEEAAGILETSAGVAPLGAGSMARLEQQAAAGSKEAAAILKAVGGTSAELAAAQEAATRETLKHPAMGVINRILNADDIVPFYDAHLWKSELQNALQGTYDKAVRKQVTSITQKLTGSLREALAVHEPYNRATAAYAEIVPLYTREYAAKLRKAALTDPEALIRMISPNKPTAARMLRDVLVTQSAEGGQPEAGRRAWDLVRSAWTNQNVLKGGVETLDKNLAKLPKEFADVFYGDETGSHVLQNLRQIASAYKAAVEAGGLGVAEAKAAGEAGVEAAREAGRAGVEATREAARFGVESARETGESVVRVARREGATEVAGARRARERMVEEATREGAVVRRQAASDIVEARQARRLAREPTLEEIRFRHSTLSGKQPTVEQIGADIARAAILGPQSMWGGLSMMRLLKGPREADLLEWAAYSDAHTRMLVDLLTGPTPTGNAISTVLRMSGVLDDLEGDQPRHQARQRQRQASGVGMPPPGARVATPPPR